MNDSAGYYGIPKYECLDRRCCYEPVEVSKWMHLHVYVITVYTVTVHIFTLFCNRGTLGASLQAKRVQLQTKKIAVRAKI